MLFQREVLAWTGRAGADDRFAALRAAGFEIQVLASAGDVAERGRRRDEGAFTPILLMADGPQTHAAIGWLRAQLPRACLVALARTAHEHESLALLRQGVDWICRPDESAALVGEVLLALWRRHLGEVPGAEPRTHEGWILRGYAWTLQGPCGGRIGLTAGERALLSALFEAPGLAAGRDALRAALDGAYDREAGAHRPAGRLEVVVNRLRVKGRRAGLSIPIRAVRGHGYVFGPTAASGQGRMPSDAAAR